MDDYDFTVVVFATPSGGVHKQQIAFSEHESPSDWIPRAVKAAKRRRVAVANCLEIRRGSELLFDAVEDLHRRLR